MSISACLCVSSCLSVCLSVYFYLSTCLSVCLSDTLSVYFYLSTCVYLSVCPCVVVNQGPGEHVCQSVIGGSCAAGLEVLRQHSWHCQYFALSTVYLLSLSLMYCFFLRHSVYCKSCIMILHRGPEKTCHRTFVHIFTKC